MSRVLVLYTGGTIGMVHQDKGNPLSPLRPGTLDEFLDVLPQPEDLGASIEVICFSPPIDSSQMSPRHWLEIARTIRDSYSRFTGFVILHGTDTMAYTASALSFILGELSKPIMVTGSQIPLSSPGTDGTRNLMTALRFAAADPSDAIYIPEVCVCFDGKILRGNRTTKVSSIGFSGFLSPNLPELALVNERIRIRKGIVRATGSGHLAVHERLEPRVLILTIFPGLSADLIRDLLSSSGLKGVVLQVYGAGTVPLHQSFLEAIRDAHDRGIVFVATTQCEMGAAEDDLRDLGFRLRDSGVIAGQDITTEAALTKLMFLLGKNQSVETVREMAQLDLRGEQSISTLSISYGPGEASPLYQGEPREPIYPFRRGRVQKAWIRLHGIERLDASTDSTDLLVRLNIPLGSEPAEIAAQQSSFELRTMIEWMNEARTSAIIEVTSAFRGIDDLDGPPSLSIFAENNQVRFERAELLLEVTTWTTELDVDLHSSV